MPRSTNIPDYLTNQLLHRRRTDKREEMRRAHQNACNLCGASCASTTTGRDPSHSPSLQSRATSGWLLRSTQPTPNPTDQAPFQKSSKDRRASSTDSSHGAAVSGSARPRRCRHRRRARALLPSRLGAVGLARRVPHGRRGPLRLRRIGQAGGVAGPGRELRRRIQLHGEVPLRRVQRRDEAGARQLRRHRHLLLPDVRRGRRARRDRHGVHGQLERRADGAQHQRVGQRRRQEGAPVLPLVRPLRRLPQVHHHLERQEHHLPRRRRHRARLPALRRPPLPGRQAHGGARHAVGRQLLGDGEGQGPHRLGRRALRRLLPGLHRQRLRRPRRRRAHVVPRRAERVDGQGARRHRPAHRRLGPAQLPAVQLLRGRVALPGWVPRRVQPRMICVRPSVHPDTRRHHHIVLVDQVLFSLG